MARISGMNFDVNMGDLLVHAENDAITAALAREAVAARGGWNALVWNACSNPGHVAGKAAVRGHSAPHATVLTPAIRPARGGASARGGRP